jgi:hypothetical protein
VKADKVAQERLQQEAFTAEDALDYMAIVGASFGLPFCIVGGIDYSYSQELPVLIASILSGAVGSVSAVRMYHRRDRFGFDVAPLTQDEARPATESTLKELRDVQKAGMAVVKDVHQDPDNAAMLVLKQIQMDNKKKGDALPKSPRLLDGMNPFHEYS